MKIKQERAQQQRHRGAERLVRPTLDVVVDRVAQQRRLGRAGHQVRRVVVAEHRQRDQHDPAQRPGLRHRQHDAPEGLRGRGAEVARGLDHPLVDPVQRRVQRQDQVRHVAVDEPENHRDRLPAEPVVAVEQPDRGEERVDREGVEDLRRVAAGVEQVRPGEHPHQVGDPERRHQQDQQDDLRVPVRVARDVVGDRVADRQREHDRQPDVEQRAQEHVPRAPARQHILDRLEDVADVPVERVPVRDRLVEVGDVAQPDGDDRVEGDEEERGEPRHARRREPPPALHPLRNSAQDWSQVRRPSAVSARYALPLA